MMSADAQPLGGLMAGSASERDALLGELYVAHFRALLRIAAVLLDDARDCEEVVQEAFVRLYAGWGRLRDPERALAYLRQAVVNQSRSRLRRLRTARGHEEQIIHLPAAEETALAAIAHDEVANAMRRLQRRQREVLVLRYLGGLSEIETAEALGLSAGSVKSYASRGLARLRIVMEAAS